MCLAFLFRVSLYTQSIPAEAEYDLQYFVNTPFLYTVCICITIIYCAHNLSIATMLYRICRYVIVAEYDFVSLCSCHVILCMFCHSLSVILLQGPLGLCLFNKLLLLSSRGQ